MTSPGDFGFDAARSIAGFCGSVVYVFFDKQTKPLTIVGSLIVGTLMANFLGDAAGRSYIGTIFGVQGASFIIGLVGTVILPAVMMAARKWKPGDKAP